MRRSASFSPKQNIQIETPLSYLLLFWASFIPTPLKWLSRFKSRLGDSTYHFGSQMLSSLLLLNYKHTKKARHISKLRQGYFDREAIRHKSPIVEAPKTWEF